MAREERTVNMRVPALARNYMLQPTYGKMSSYFHTDKSRWHITVLFFPFFLFSDLYLLYQLAAACEIHVWIRERESTCESIEVCCWPVAPWLMMSRDVHR